MLKGVPARQFRRGGLCVAASGAISASQLRDVLIALFGDWPAEAPAAMPARGMSMAQVEARFGAPAERMDPRGGQKRQWPTINRWVYPGFVVYFEKNHVIDAVANKAAPNEVGPKPAIR